MGKGVAILRDKRVWLTAATVVALAAVIFGVAAISAPKETPPEATKPIPEVEAESLAQEAETALSNGETSTAVALAEQALKSDPKNASAQQVIERVQLPEPQPASNTESSDSSSSGSGPKPSDDGVYGSAVSDIEALLPVSIKGWSAGTVVTQKGEALVTFEPNSGTAPSKTTVRALVIAHDRASKAKAQEFVTKVDKRVYSKDKATVDIGAMDAYFGTDGTRLAVVAFARGRYAFEVILTAQPQVKPATLKSVGIAVASKLPAAK